MFGITGLVIIILVSFVNIVTTSIAIFFIIGFYYLSELICRNNSLLLLKHKYK